MMAVAFAFVEGIATGLGLALLIYWRARRREPVVVRKYTEAELDAILRKELRLR